MGGRQVREIARVLPQYGINVNESYISRLRTGKKPPPTPEMVRALAMACGRDPVPLEFAASCERDPGPILEAVLDAVSGGEYARRPSSMEDLLKCVKGGDSSDG